jgi:glutathione S-transferase
LFFVFQLNPHHNVPTLVDGDFVTNESRPAAAYLINKYGGDKKSELYPESPVERARVDQRMYFDMGTFYKAFGECVVSWKLSISSCYKF